MNLAGIDLNLLLVFDAVMAERHVTRAGDKIGMSQPAMSNALNRLRHHLKDELFVRGSDGMRPTPRAVELAAPIRAALHSLEAALDPADFDPGSAKRMFSIGTNDYGVTTLMPEVARRLEVEAPGINIRLVLSAGHTFEMLDAQELDFGLSAFGEIPERFGSKLLIEDTYVLMLRKGHPLAKGKLTLAKYAVARHMLMSPRGDPNGFVDRALVEHGLTRQVAMTINSFSSAPLLLANSDLILTAPKRIADTYAPLYDIVTRPAPFSGPRSYASATLVWHARLGSHPAHVWFRDLLADIASTLD
ncbi:MAG: LysR family transcriptional regulator [Pseudomonadota bacterium]